MELDQIAAQLRVRNTWESIDLGFAMARQWFIPLWKLWIIIALPFFFLSAFFFHNEKNTWIGILIVWWCKPLYEPALTFWLSRTLFSEKVTLKEVLKQWFSIIKPLFISHLLWNRLNANRSFYYPVVLLEKQTGKNRIKRINVLGYGQNAYWLTWICAIFETILFYSFHVLLFIMIPKELIDTLTYQQFLNMDFMGILNYFFLLMAMSIIAPFYVAAGFSLYINRRTELEAWDIEIEFRKIRDGI